MSTDVVLLILAAVLVMVAGILAGAEAAVSRVRLVRANELVEEGVRGSKALAAIAAEPARYVNVLLFLRLACMTMATSLVVVVCIGFWGSSWTAVLVAAASMLVVNYVVVGVAPRTLGRQQPVRVGLATAGVVRVLARVLSPLTRLLILVGNAITPGKGFRDGPFSSEAELRELVDLAQADQVIEDDERQMIHSVFELGDTVVREVMVPRTDMVFIERGKTLRQALSLGLRSGFSRIPVVGEGLDDVVGLVYLKDVARRSFDHRDAESIERVESLMRPVTAVPDSKPVDELLREMQAARVHMAVVIDEYGGTAGLVTIEDILEEIVGEIADEYDVESPEVVAHSDGSYRIPSRLPVDDLAELIGVRLKDEVDTVGGLFAERLGVVPIPGASIEVGDYRLTAEAAQGRRNRISTVLVEPLVIGEVADLPVRDATPPSQPPSPETADG
jgi:CBS domain containing-hemolysin-like protein